MTIIVSDEHLDPTSMANNKNDSSTFGLKTYAYQEEFVKAIEIYQDASQDPSIRALDLKQQHTWAEVMEKARKAETLYLAAGQSGTRKYLRTFSSYAQAGESFTKLLPNDNCVSILAGGLKLVFDAAARISKHREEVLRKLVQIPLVILHAEECCRIYGHDAELNAFAERLFVAALSAIEGIISSFERKSINKQVRALLSGELYSKPFQEKMTDLDEALVDLEAKTNRLQAATIQSTNREVSLQAETIQHTNREVKVMQEQVEKLDRMNQAHEKTLDRMMRILADQKEHAKWMKSKESDIRRVHRRVYELEAAHNGMTLTEFTELLDVDEQNPQSDLRAMLRFDSSLELDIPSGLLESEAFRSWHKERSSMVLFVEGAASVLDSRRASPLSVVCGQLIKLHESSPQATVIYFFCGHHISPADVLEGPAGMLRSLIQQVLRAYPKLKLNFLSAKLRSQLTTAEPDVRPLCTCLRHLISQIPASDVVFFVIDGICFFEKKRWSEDCRKTLYELLELTQDETMYPIIKLLVTSPSRTRYIGKIFPPEVVLNIDSENERTQPTERETAMANAKLARISMRESMRRSSHTHRSYGRGSDINSEAVDDSQNSE